MSQFSIGLKGVYQFHPRDLKCYEVIGVTFVLEHNDSSIPNTLEDVFGSPPFKNPPCNGKKCFTDRWGPILIAFHFEEERSSKLGQEELIQSISFDVNIWLDCGLPTLTLEPPAGGFQPGEKANVQTCLLCGVDHFQDQLIEFYADGASVTPETLKTSLQCQPVEVTPDLSETCENAELFLEAEYLACYNEAQGAILETELETEVVFPLEGTWLWVEVANEEDCGEGVNTGCVSLL